MTDSDADSPSQLEEGFLSRWSRRKHVAKTAADEKPLEESLEESLEGPQGGALIAEDTAEEHSDAAPAEEDLPTDSDMPALESLDNDSDYSGFMSPKVSDELRNLALRKLFLGGMFNTRDGLDDYDDDFTTFEKLGDVVTADMRHQMEMAKAALESSEAAEEILVEEDMSLREEESSATGVAAELQQKAEPAVSTAEQDIEQNRTADNSAYENETYIEDSNADNNN